MTSYLQVTSAAGSRDEAARIAQALVERRLAGCVQILGPVSSIYRWHGKVEHAEEWLLLAKTHEAKYPEVEAAIRELHSYETPEIIAMPISQAAPAYLAWLAGQL